MCDRDNISYMMCGETTEEKKRKGRRERREREREILGKERLKIERKDTIY